MAYDIPYSHAMPGQQFFQGNMYQPVYHLQEDLMQIEGAWMDNIDPLLRQTQPQECSLAWRQQPLQRFMIEPQRNFFTAGPLPNQPQSFPRGLDRFMEGISSLPQAAPTRRVSPSPSQEISSQGSSARSPAPETEWYQDNYYSPQQDDYAPRNLSSHLTQGLPELWNNRPQCNAFPQPPGYSCVSLNQVQVIPDPQDVSFEADEGYMDMGRKTEYTIVVENRVIKAESAHSHNSYRHSSDEGLGTSIKDEGSPPNSGNRVDIDIDNDATTSADVDAEGEDDIIVAEPTSDTEYSPKSTRTRKRRISKVSSPPTMRRSRVTKASPKSKSSFTCKSCTHAPFKDAAALQRHVHSMHTRAFICVFGFAGCPSTFASKNEWKRHVSSQHLNLNSWVCEQGACGKVQPQSKKDGSGVVKGSEFNRKDLFTQHLRRMHAPFDVKRMNKKNPEWEERLKELQISCLRAKRQPPTTLGCPLGECDGFFDSASCWDDRMEHVAKHLEKAAISTGANSFTVDQQDDDLLVSWALRERIIDKTSNGDFKLCGLWFEKAPNDDDNDDEDADCEYE